MEKFSEFETQGGVPEKNSGSIISYAFEAYKGSFLYVLAVVGIVLVVGFVISTLTGSSNNYQELLEEMKGGGGGLSAVTNMPGMGLYYGVSGLVNLLLTPLFIGLMYVFNKVASGENANFNDLFIGYKQNTLNIIVYAIISGIILAVSILLCVFPFFFVAPFLMLGVPLLLFENASFSEALTKSYNIAKENYGVFLGATILGMLISIAGVVLCGIGVLFTMYFYYAVMYALYVAYVGKPIVKA